MRNYRRMYIALSALLSLFIIFSCSENMVSNPAGSDNQESFKPDGPLANIQTNGTQNDDTWGGDSAYNDDDSGGPGTDLPKPFEFKYRVVYTANSDPVTINPIPHPDPIVDGQLILPLSQNAYYQQILRINYVPEEPWLYPSSVDLTYILSVEGSVFHIQEVAGVILGGDAKFLAEAYLPTTSSYIINAKMQVHAEGEFLKEYFFDVLVPSAGASSN